MSLGAIKELQAFTEFDHVNCLALTDVFFHSDRVNFVIGECWRKAHLRGQQPPALLQTSLPPT